MALTDWVRRASGLLMPRPAFFWANCPCCGAPSCTILADDFTRADSTNLGSNWTEDAGDWYIDTNTLYTATDNAIALAVPTAPDCNLRVQATIKGSTNGSQARIILNYTDDANYDFVQVQFGTGATLKIYSRRSSSNTLQASVSITAATATSYNLSACEQSNGVICALFNGVTQIFGDVPDATSGTFGFASGSVASGNVRFDDLNSLVVSSDCYECGCLACGVCAHDPPAEYAITIAGLTNASCANCTDANGTFYLRRCQPLGTLCEWYATFYPVCTVPFIGDINTYLMHFIDTGGGNTALIVQLVASDATSATPPTGSSAPIQAWRNDYAAVDGPINCNFSSLVVAPQGGGTICGAVATCMVSAV